jgi:hypothetical protein
MSARVSLRAALQAGPGRETVALRSRVQFLKDSPHDQLFDYLRQLHAGEPLVEVLVFEGEPFVLKAGQMEHRGVEVADV